MDIARPDVKRRKQRRRIVVSASAVLALTAVTVGLSRLSPALQMVEKSGLIIDSVKRGVMLRQVRGNGTLIPEEILIVQAESEGRIDRLPVLPGAAVHADTVLVELSNPDLEQQVFDLEWQLKGADATLRRLKVQLESDRLAEEAAVEKLKAELLVAKLEADADFALSTNGLIPEIIRKRSAATVEQLAHQVKAEERRLFRPIGSPFAGRGSILIGGP